MKHSELRHQPRHVNPRIQAECCAHHNPTFHREPFVRDAGGKLLTLLKCLCRGCSEVPHGGYE